ncbi:hypothetical protein AC231_01845 [Clostridium pasteurianum]|uniref:hypothetical protein n=1 Tax=Clostridium pasteurianum TaxID=1501 RepID=UPI000976B971|nr:hypothetical protein [Clostridium pasteurianum]OMH22442.1 hypothetical protein AC231_01845 [Clostridium pasteurianum]
MISVISLIILMLAAGCSNTNKNPSNQQSSTTSGNSENNKPSNAASPDSEAKDAALNGLVAKIDGNKISIIKMIKKDNKDNSNGSMPKKGSSAATKNMITFELSNNTTVIVRTVSNQGIKNTDTKDAAGSISDIKENSFVEVWTKKDGDTVTASKVIVSIFN